MKHFKALAVASALTVFATNAFSYDVVNRYKLIDDKLKTEQMLRPIGHDFFLDIGAAANKDVKTFVTDLKDAGSATDKVTAAQNLLTKYDKTEQTVKINVGLGFPIFSFSAWDLKVQPNVRALVDVGANIGIRSDVLTTADLVNLFPVEVPQELKTLLGTLRPGQDAIAECKNAPTVTAATKALCATLPVGKYIIPNLTTTVPNVALFAKVDGRVGLFNDYTYGEHFFGNLNLYGLSRTDIFQRVTKDMIQAGSKVELPTTKNTETTLNMDYRLGYQNSNYKVFASVEDLKLSTMTAKKAGSRDLSYGYDPLLRLHADAMYKFSVLSLNPFVGFHKRSGYGFSDGMYLGADAGAHVWGDRLGLQLRGMVDNQYFTLSPRLKLWLIQLEYSLKAPMKSMDGDVKLSAIHSIDFRLFF